MTLGNMMNNVKYVKVVEEFKTITDDVLPRWAYNDKEWNVILFRRTRLRKLLSQLKENQ